MEAFSIGGRLPEPQKIDERIAAGDTAAEAELAAYFGPRIRAFVASRASGRDFAEEVVQETMMALICSLREGRLRESDSLAGFAYGIARNRLADAIRKDARRRTVPIPEDFDCPSPVASQEPDLVSAARSRIETMEPTDRKILWMTLIDWFKPGEVAAAVGISADAVRQRKSRALKKLVEHLKPLSRIASPVRLIGKRPE